MYYICKGLYQSSIFQPTENLYFGNFSPGPTMECSIVDIGYKRMSIILKIFERYACLPFHNICKWPTKVAPINKLLRIERINLYQRQESNNATRLEKSISLKSVYSNEHKKDHKSELNAFPSFLLIASNCDG